MSTIENLFDKNMLAPFENIFKAMNISENQIKMAIDDINLPPLDYSESYALKFDGIELDKDFSFEMPEILEPQFYFKYKQRAVVVYQKDQFLSMANYKQKKYRPYHLCFCSALQESEQKNRYENRYVMAYNTSGKFRANLFVRDINSANKIYTLKKEQDIYLPLRVCQHCLREINWKNFRSYCGGGLEWWRGGSYTMRQKIVDEFNLEEYLLTARENNFLDHPVDGTAASSTKKEYKLSPEIKSLLKEMADYTCEVCHEKFSPNNLQIHHKNHNEGDNRRANLMVVCTTCHALIHDAEDGFVSHRKNLVNVTTKEKQSKSGLTQKEILAKFEYAQAQKNLGDMYFNGLGVEKNEDKAQEFYQNACNAYKNLSNLNDADAQYELANLYLNLRDKEKFRDKARKLFESVVQKYSNSNNTRAKIRLALMYAKGLGVEKNLTESRKIIESIKKNIEIADSELVELCQLAGNIDDAQKFHAKAVRLFEVAANNGDTVATFELAKLYSNKDFIGSNFEDYDFRED